MKNPIALVALSSLAAALVGPAHAQPRPVVARDGGARDTRHVVRRGPGAWEARCVASAGCEAPRTVPRCAAAQAAGPVLSFAQAIDQRFRLAGQTVAVRGRLSAGGGCTEMACPEGVCCNHCRGAVALTGEARSSMRQLSLGVADEAVFVCRGDDSGLCCGTEVAAGDVVVRGVLRPVPNSGGAWRIESPTLCAE